MYILLSKTAHTEIWGSGAWTDGQTQGERHEERRMKKPRERLESKRKREGRKGCKGWENDKRVGGRDDEKVDRMERELEKVCFEPSDQVLG